MRTDIELGSDEGRAIARERERSRLSYVNRGWFRNPDWFGWMKQIRIVLLLITSLVLIAHIRPVSAQQPSPAEIQELIEDFSAFLNPDGRHGPNDHGKHMAARKKLSEIGLPAIDPLAKRICEAEFGDATGIEGLDLIRRYTNSNDAEIKKAATEALEYIVKNAEKGVSMLAEHDARRARRELDKSTMGSQSPDGLIAILAGDDRFRKRDAENALKQIGKDAIEPVADWLVSGRYNREGLEVLTHLAKVQDSRISDPAIKALERVTNEATDEMARIRAQSALRDLTGSSGKTATIWEDLDSAKDQIQSATRSLMSGGQVRNAGIREATRRLGKVATYVGNESNYWKDIETNGRGGVGGFPSRRRRSWEVHFANAERSLNESLKKIVERPLDGDEQQSRERIVEIQKYLTIEAKSLAQFDIPR